MESSFPEYLSCLVAFEVPVSALESGDKAGRPPPSREAYPWSPSSEQAEAGTNGLGRTRPAYFLGGLSSLGVETEALQADGLELLVVPALAGS